MSPVRSHRAAFPRPLLATALIFLLALSSVATAVDNEECLDCHEGDEAEEVDPERFAESVHGESDCTDCHADATVDHDETDEPLAQVDCSECHAEEVDAYSTGTHGQLLAENDPDAPDCAFCHGTHEILSQREPRSRSFPLNVPSLCAECHEQGERSARRNAATQTRILQNYSMSIHGKGLLESGLLTSATCSSCHTAHMELPAADPRSSVHPDNVVETCGTCHYGIHQKLEHSVHSAAVTETDQKLPGCNDCHRSHTIQRVEWSAFRTEIISQCGECHEEQIETYFDTYHGKVSKLGAMRTARCHDCHGSHNILARSDPHSTLHEERIVETCRQCHPRANENFVQYLTHATRDDRGSFPQLYYSFWFMTILLLGTIGFFAVHSILWLIRSLVVRSSDGHEARAALGTEPGPGEYYRRFDPVDRVLHLMVIVSFLSLAFTGMALKFPDTEFFAKSTRFLGGPAVTGAIHRLGAVITFAYFAIHLSIVAGKLWRREISFRGLVREDYSLIPLGRDLRELKDSFLWFFGLGPRPMFGRWTYWEKFDYMAVFWGVTVIGLTGLIMWFPEVATLVLPGWMINVASVIHSEEALLAAAFIFTVHFFNTHFRPEKFPMDRSIFTGRVPLAEFRKEHPREYERLLSTGELSKHLVGPPARWLSVSAWVLGVTFLSMGLGIIGTIVYSILFE